MNASTDDTKSVVPVTIGMGLCVAAMFANTAMDTLAKFATDAGSTWQLVFLRWIFGLTLLLPVMIARGSRADWTFRRRIHLNRMVLNLIGSLCLFYSLRHLPLAVVVTIFFTEPLITVIFARIILREHVSIVRWLCTILAFVAVVFVSIPAGESGLRSLIDIHALAAFAGAFAWGLMRVLTKRDRAETTTLSLMFWMAATTTVFAVPGAAIDWHPLGWQSLIVLFGVAVLGNAYNYLWLQALNVVPASFIANFFYLLLPLSFAAGYLAFGEIPSFNSYVGSLVVLILVFISTHATIERRLTRALGTLLEGR